MPEAVRLVIWDLDETFWKGTLTEGGISEYVLAHHDLVIELARRGIMSSICSKNDLDVVKKILTDRGIWDYFIFPSIDWTPKAQRVAAIVEMAQLRPPTVMFVDDNPGNLGEVATFVPGIQVESEKIIPAMLDSSLFQGKPDPQMARLAQYKVLEKKREGELAAGGDNKAFLRASNIRVVLDFDVMASLDRAVELVNRTNQLNYTKRRLPEDLALARQQLAAELDNHDARAALVKVVDDYGDYGVVGFFLIRGTNPRYRTEHFCFSCRTLGMGIESWVYEWLGRPRLVTVGEVLTDLSVRQEIDWITLQEAGDAESNSGATRTRFPSVRLRGACDLEVMAHYFRVVTDELVSELSSVRGGLDVRFDHSAMFVHALQGVDEAALEALRPLGFEPQDFRTTMFSDAPPGTVWLYNGWGDTKSNLYRHKETGVAVPYKPPATGFTRDICRMTEEEIEAALDAQQLPPARRVDVRTAVDYLRANFVFEGDLRGDRLREMRRKIFEAVPKHGHLYAIIGNEFEKDRNGQPIVRVRMKELNDITIELARDFPNITVLPVSDFLEKNESLGNDHLSRRVYFNIFQRIRELAAVAESKQSHSELVPA